MRYIIFKQIELLGVVLVLVATALGGCQAQLTDASIAEMPSKIGSDAE